MPPRARTSTKRGRPAGRKRRRGAARGGSAVASGALDFVRPARAVNVELVSGRGHYERVIAAVLAARTSVWIATATLKELLVEGGPSVRRGRRANDFRSVLAALEELAARGVELRVLHGELPSRPFRAELLRRPAIATGGLALRRCPRVHLKLVIVDGATLYLGSANWTGAGLGARGSGRRNFELGVVTDDGVLLDEAQALMDRVWRGAECAGCKLRDECPGPLDGDGGNLVKIDKIATVPFRK
jgi:phosphatidylserine/phosphatidylglycerophosphate/cardiolipin synthase-like enzyme